MHSYIRPVAYNKAIMPLLASVKSEINAIGNNHIIAYLNIIIAHIVQIATHSDKHMLSYLITAAAVTPHTQIAERNGRNQNRRKPLAKRFRQYRADGIITIIRGGNLNTFL